MPLVLAGKLDFVGRSLPIPNLTRAQFLLSFWKNKLIKINK